ncbi:unnamed protein product [Ilex paraguariensis]|uniref:Enhanced disease susceptibility 1 n=1 Tax=Ilex paraguariensis TaxID=185542 RepID=A0ABC8UAZ5_9AQUA
MEGQRFENNVGMSKELIQKACCLSIEAQKSTGKPYLSEKSHGLSAIIFGFAGSWSKDDWFSRKPFRDMKVNLEFSPSLRSIGNDEVATVNEAFYSRFQETKAKSSLEVEVYKAVSEKRQIVFAGHSSGGAIAILAAIWFLEKYIRSNATTIPPNCVTFGSPLVGDRIFQHGLRRENWAPHFLHFVLRYDIVPRIMLCPVSSIEQELQPILDLFKPKSSSFEQEFSGISSIASTFFTTVVRNASSVASHDAFNLMEYTNLLLKTVTSSIEISPYRPFGTYIFCTGNGKLVVLRNPDAILQLLFYGAQPSSEADGARVIYKSFKEHLIYEDEVKKSLNTQDVVYLDHLDDLATTDAVLNDLDLSTGARLCLQAAGEMEKKKLQNQEMTNSLKVTIEKGLKKVQDYQTECEARNVGYYDAFKLHKYESDFYAHVSGFELGDAWDPIIEMLKKYELPDEFEGKKEWIELGTRYRQLVEPLSIANYYRHLKGHDTGPYLIKGRPKLYRYTQRWREHAERMPAGSSSESCFLAEVEELRTETFDDVKGRILTLEKQVLNWVRDGELRNDIFLDESTFVKWWKMLPPQHRAASCISEYMGS